LKLHTLSIMHRWNGHVAFTPKGGCPLKRLLSYPLAEQLFG